MSEIKGDAAKQAVDHLIGQGLVDPEQRYNIAQVIREKYAALSSLQAKHDRAIKALQEIVNHSTPAPYFIARDIAAQALADEVTDERTA